MIRMHSRHVALLLGALVLSLASAGFAAPARAADFTPGSAGLGDPFFPNAGNGGYDVSNYSLTLSYEPETNHLAGTAVVSARATQDLSRFNLDLRGFTISQLLVDGRAASFARDGQELMITPRPPGIRTGSTFTVSNLGMFGVEEFSAIINPPEGAILAVGAIVDKPVVVDGQLAVGKRMRVTLSADHRVMDGAMGARFLADLKAALEAPLALLV